VTLVDTSAWIEFLRDSERDVGNRVQSLMDIGAAAWCDIVALELINGSTFAQREKLASLEYRVPLLQINERVWKVSRQLATAARAKGISAPIADLIIAACARVHGVAIEHKNDRHFEMLSTIPI
jgi:predicted nucleic acid-binding protein